MNKRGFNENVHSDSEDSVAPDNKQTYPNKKRRKANLKIGTNNSFIMSMSYNVRSDDNPHVFVSNPSSPYIKIGDYIYKTKSYNKLDKKFEDDDIEWKISLNKSQYNDVKAFIYDKNRVTISNFNSIVKPAPYIKIDLTTNSNYKFFINKEKLIGYIIHLLTDHIVSVDQNIDLHFDGVPMKICIVTIGDLYLGKIISETIIYFKSIDPNIIVQNDCVELPNHDVAVYVTKCISINGNYNGQTSKFPVIIDNKVINKYVRNTFNETFTDNEYMNYTVNDYEYTFNIKVLGQATMTKFKNTYTLSHTEGLLDVRSSTENVIITNGKRKAKKINFCCQSINSQKYTPTDNILFYDDLVAFVLSKHKRITNNQSIKYISKTKEIALKTEYINPNHTDNTMYTLDSNTKISFNINTKSNFIIVHNKQPQTIDTITFKIKKDSPQSIFSLMMGDDDDGKMVIFDSNKLEKIARNKFPSKTVIKHKASVQYNGNNYMLVVKEMKFEESASLDCVDNPDSTEDQPKLKKKYATYGLITSDTKIKFKPSKANKSYIINDANNQTDIPKNPIEELEKHVGGISKELETVVRTLCLSRGKLKSEYLSRGLRPVKGIILHGPPGTGKTSLSRNLGKILGCEGDRFKLMSGPEIFNKWVGGSESNIRAIFKPAKEAWKKHGDKSPVYMVVIDEIDAMIPARSGSDGNPVRDSVVNQFLAEMDGLEIFNNLICIGITNRLELLDPATIRSGRFGLHIKIDLPDRDGRIKIFHIHTNKLKELNRIASIDYIKLSEKTDGLSGADLEGIVELASTYSLERVNKLDEINDDIIKTTGKVTMDDLLRAIEEITCGKNKSNNEENLCRIFS